MWPFTDFPQAAGSHARPGPARSRRHRSSEPATAHRPGHADRRPVPGRLPDRRVRARLLLGRGEDVLGAARRLDDRGRLPGRLHAQPDVRGVVHRQDRPRRDGARRVRPVEDELRAAAEGLLGEPRPDAGHAPGQRRRHAVPLGDLRRRTTPSAAAAEASKAMYQEQLSAAGYGEITTEIVGPPAPTFYFAEDYHQQYLDKNPEWLLPEPFDGRDAAGRLRGHAAAVRGLTLRSPRPLSDATGHPADRVDRHPCRRPRSADGGLHRT